MNNRQRKTLEAIFEKPTRADIAWPDVESLFEALGAAITEGRGSRVRVLLKKVKTVFHRPHPRRIAGKAMVEDVRVFLTRAGVAP